MRKEIILVRHGETEENVKEIFRGRLDVELKQTGVRQAELLSDRLSNLKIEAIFSSPLKRALKTAEILAKPHRITPQISEDLIDFNFGKWEGLSHPEVKEKYPDLYENWLRTPHLVKMPGGERLSDVRSRVRAVVQKAIEYERSVLVSHRVVLKILICELLNMSNSRFWKIKLDVGGITCFEFDPERGFFVLAKHNDTSHLRPIQKEALADF